MDEHNRQKQIAIVNAWLKFEEIGVKIRPFLKNINSIGWASTSSGIDFELIGAEHLDTKMARVKGLLTDTVEWCRPISLRGVDNNNGWIKILSDINLPDQGQRVLGYSRAWIDDDFNPEGVRECHRSGFDDCLIWTSSYWDNYFDRFQTDDQTSPTHWKPLPLSIPIY